MINKELAESRDISKEDQELIELLQTSRSIAEGYATTLKDKEDIKRVYETWIKQHKELQRLWGFEQDDKYIKFWEFPACGCPTMDNNDAYPTGYYVIDGGCIIHGDEVNKSQENKDE